MNRIVKYPLHFNGNVIIYNNISILFTSEVVIEASQNFFYPHFCVIYRGGTTDSDGNEVFEGVFYGICGYDLGSDGSTSLRGSFSQASPTLIIPDTDCLFRNGDKVIVTLDEERIVEASVEQFEIQKEINLTGTTIWLEQAVDKQDEQ